VNDGGAPACCQKGAGFHAGEMCSGLFTFLSRSRAGLEHGENSGNFEKSRKNFRCWRDDLGLGDCSDRWSTFRTMTRGSVLISSPGIPLEW